MTDGVSELLISLPHYWGKLSLCSHNKDEEKCHLTYSEHANRTYHMLSNSVSLILQVFSILFSCLSTFYSYFVHLILPLRVHN